MKMVGNWIWKRDAKIQVIETETYFQICFPKNKRNQCVNYTCLKSRLACSFSLVHQSFCTKFYNDLVELLYIIAGNLLYYIKKIDF